MSGDIKCCPFCQAPADLLDETRGGFVEQGEYDDKRGEYEVEFNITGWRCRACNETFYVEG